MSNQRVALVTGAGSGIGRAVSLSLGKAGYAVMLTGRRRAELERTAEAVRSFGAPPSVQPADVSKPDAVNALFSAVRDKYGRLDVLFNNAGINAPPLPFEELSYEQWTAVVDVNLTGAFLCAQAAFRVMKTQLPGGGRIINNGSISAHAPRPNSAP